MKRSIAALLTGTAATAAIAIALPGTASAHPQLPPTCDKATIQQLHQQIMPQMAQYAVTHPDVALEFAQVHMLPKDQRRAQMKTWAQAHPQEVQDIKNIRTPMRDYFKSCDPNFGMRHHQ